MATSELQDHTYASSSRPPAIPNPKRKQSYTTLGVQGGGDVVGSLESLTVNLLAEDGKVVGTATTLTGDQLHGKTIPSGWLRVVIKHIYDGVRPRFETAFDEQFLCVGNITAWPTNQVKSCML